MFNLHLSFSLSVSLNEGTNLRRTLKTQSGSGAEMVIIVGYSMDRVEEDCNEKFTVNNEELSVTDLIVNDAKYIAKRDSPNGILDNVPLQKIDKKRGGNSEGRRNDDGNNGKNRDLSATVASEFEKHVAANQDHHRELACECSPGGNCEACCLALCSHYGWVDCMAGNWEDPCNVRRRRRRKLDEVTYDNEQDEIRRLQDLSYAKTIAENYAFELQITARMLNNSQQKNGNGKKNLCLGSNPDDIWVTVEVWENNDDGTGSNKKLEGSFVP